jgi:[ribosomal protein S5]-alanine N-acetyltransferase
MQLVLEGCTIRPWRLDDAESIARHANNRKVWLAVRDAFPHPYTIDSRLLVGRGVLGTRHHN